MDIKKCISFILQILADNKNRIFLYMCLGVHLSYLIFFMIIKVNPFVFLNFVSTVFYIVFLIYCKDRKSSEFSTVAAYYEIMVFSVISEIVARNTYGFIFFVVGMIPSIFFLAPTFGKKRFIFQASGMLVAITIDQMKFLISDSWFPATYQRLEPYAERITFINLLITLSTILYVTFFYKLETDVMRSQLEYQCTHDSLTGLYNRRFLYGEIDKDKDMMIAVAIMDIDNFKKINDTFGHDEGDLILKTVSECLMTDADKSDSFSVRWGGEEFIMYYKNIDRDAAFERITDLCRTINEKTVLPDETHITVTAGLVSGISSQFDQIVKTADDYLYTGKNNGKNCIIWEQNISQYLA